VKGLVKGCQKPFTQPFTEVNPSPRLFVWRQSGKEVLHRRQMVTVDGEAAHGMRHSERELR
jgi:hypothetical protein